MAVESLLLTDGTDMLLTDGTPLLLAGSFTQDPETTPLVRSYSLDTRTTHALDAATSHTLDARTTHRRT